MMHKIQRKWNRENLTALSFLFIMLAFLSMPFSATGISLSLIVAAFFSLLATGFKNLFRCWKSYNLFYFLMALIVILFIEVFYNSFSRAFAWHEFKKYAGNFFLALLVLPVFFAEKYRKRLLSWMVIVAFITSIFWASCLYFKFNLLFGKPIIPNIISKIPWSYFLALSAFLLAHQICENPKKRVYKILVLIWFFYCLFFISNERSGMIVGLLLAIVLSFQRFKTRYAILSLFLVPLIAISLYFISPMVHRGVVLGYHDIQAFKKGELRTSWGLRLAFAQNSFHLIKERPVFGYGTGAFPYAYQTTKGPTLSQGSMLGDPHNTYLHLWVEIGIIGLCVFLLFLFSLWAQAKKLPQMERFLIQGLVLSFSTMCFLVSALLRQRIEVLFLLLMIVGIASYRTAQKNVRLG